MIYDLIALSLCVIKRFIILPYFPVWIFNCLYSIIVKKIIIELHIYAQSATSTKIRNSKNVYFVRFPFEFDFYSWINQGGAFYSERFIYIYVCIIVLCVNTHKY